MAPPRKQYSLDMRNLVIKKHLNKISNHEISGQLCIPRTSVLNIVRNFKDTGNVGQKPGRGRKRKTSALTDRLIVRKVLRDRRKSASTIEEETKAELAVSISEQTVRNRIQEKGLHGRVARKKPLIKPHARKMRLHFCKQYGKQPVSFWNNVLWSDESKFNLFGSDGKVMVWRQPGEEFFSECTVPTVKHGGGSIMVWGYFASSGVGNLVIIRGNMDTVYYKAILKRNLKESGRKLKLKRGWWFQQDNDPKHTSILVTNWLKKNHPKLLFWAPYSPDFNPIEHLWAEVERRLRKIHLVNMDDLERAIVDVWYSIEPEFCEKLVHSMPTRIARAFHRAIEM
ncbi:hypothetical protein RvY_12274 [Ramazzottius varieornatus]|uniref:Tc1-like transposase DDE domain-containing protein n=1 Tax=Ramazzottius varieornatus TaxID=947166 RepID=A0A1D1VL98_RAMVA|nr:hypothetical protein RvY_12274 [Ramazzottius varieornatus]